MRRVLAALRQPVSAPSNSRNSRRRKRNESRPAVEHLEVRNLLSTTSILPVIRPDAAITALAAGANASAPANSSGPYTPAQIQSAYGFNRVSQTGAGQTIAIVDAYNDPNIASDVAAFNSAFGLQQFNGTGGPKFTVQNQSGATVTSANAPPGSTSWGVEESLDVEWAHAIAPQANVVLVEANSSSISDLLSAVKTAAGQASVVSMSWGGNEFSGETGSAYDGVFSSLLKAHPGLTFVASSGDSGSLQGPEWPAVSPYVLSVGGTTLGADASGNYLGESAWGNSYGGNYAYGSYFYGGSGGGISRYESQPSFQSGVVKQSTTRRTTPDVAYDANPNTGVYVYDTYYSGGGGWFEVGGTSAGAPQWAGLLALVNQGRTATGAGSLGQAQYAIYSAYKQNSADFHDITTGSNGYAAGPGYDLVTGLGSPVAGNSSGGGLVKDLINSSATPAASVTKTATPQTTVTVSTSGQGRGFGRQAVVAAVTPSSASTATLTTATAVSIFRTLAANPQAFASQLGFLSATASPALAGAAGGFDGVTPVGASVPRSFTGALVVPAAGAPLAAPASQTATVSQSGGGGQLVGDDNSDDDSSSDNSEARAVPAFRGPSVAGGRMANAVFLEAVRRIDDGRATFRVFDDVPTMAPDDDAVGSAEQAADGAGVMEGLSVVVLFGPSVAGLIREERRQRPDVTV